MVYCIVVGALPYPGFKGCFIMYTSQNIMFIWVLLLAWDACKCKYIVKCPSSDWRGSIVNVHVGTCHPSMWEILVLKISLAQLMFSNLDQDGGNTSLMTVVYHDGKSLLFFFLVKAPLNVDIGVIYYLYLFGRSCAWNEWANHLWNLPVLTCINIIVIKTLLVSWAPSDRECHEFANLHGFKSQAGMGIGCTPEKPIPVMWVWQVWHVNHECITSPPPLSLTTTTLLILSETQQTWGQQVKKTWWDMRGG